MVRDYELTLILRSQLEEEGIASTIEKVKGWIEGEGGTVVRVDHWGRRRLAYLIRKEREGFYVFVLAQLDPAQVVRIERNIKLSEDILRHLFVRIEPESKPEAAAA